MASISAICKTIAVAQVATATFATYDASTTRTITIGGKAISVVDSGGNLTAALAALAVALNASTHPYFTAITWTSDATKIYGTADVAGLAFVFAGSVSGGTGTASNAYTVTTANSGPFCIDTAANWSGGAVPVNSDVVSIGPGIMFFFGTDQHTITPASVAISMSAKCGLPLDRFLIGANATTGALTYDTTVAEYREDFLRWASPILTIINDVTNPGSSPLIKFDSVTANMKAGIYGSGTRADGRAPVRIRGTNSGSIVKVFGSSTIEVSNEDFGETGEVSNISVYEANGIVIAGVGLTQASHNQVAGKGYLANVPAIVTVEPGAYLRMMGTGTITTLNNRGSLDPRGATIAVTAMGG